MIELRRLRLGELEVGRDVGVGGGRRLEDCEEKILELTAARGEDDGLMGLVG